MSSNAEIQLGQQQMVTDLGTQWSDATAGGAAVVELGLAGFNALNTAGDQTVTLGVAGLNTADSIATTGFTTVSNVATTGMDNLNEMKQFGMTTVGAIGTHGMDTGETLGIQGMLGIHETNEDWLNYVRQEIQVSLKSLQISKRQSDSLERTCHIPSLVTMMATECLTALVVVTLKV